MHPKEWFEFGCYLLAVYAFVLMLLAADYFQRRHHRKHRRR